MPFETAWHEPKHIIFIRYSGVLELRDFVNYNNQLVKMLNDGERPVHILADTHQLKGVVPQAVDIKEALSYVGHPNLGWVNIYGANKFVHFLALVVFQMTKTRVRFHQTQAEALDFIRDVDRTEFQYVKQVQTGTLRVD